MIATNVSTNKYKQAAERELHRYEFVEFIVRLGLTKYKEPKKVETLMESTDMIFVNDILPNNRSVDGLNFRQEYMYNLKVDEIFKKNESVIFRLYDLYLNPAKKFITLEECMDLLKLANLNVPEWRCRPCYTESMMSRVDTMSDLNSL